MKRQDEINIKFIISYSLLIDQIQKYIVIIEGNGVTSFKQTNNISTIFDAKKALEYMEQEAVDYIEDIPKKEFAKANDVLTNIRMLDKFDAVKKEFIKACGF